MRAKKLTTAVARNVRQIAERKKLPITVLADLAGVSRAHLFTLLSDKGDVTLGWLSQVATALGVEPAALLKRDVSADIQKFDVDAASLLLNPVENYQHRVAVAVLACRDRPLIEAVGKLLDVPKVLSADG